MNTCSADLRHKGVTTGEWCVAEKVGDYIDRLGFVTGQQNFLYGKRRYSIIYYAAAMYGDDNVITNFIVPVK